MGVTVQIPDPITRCCWARIYRTCIFAIVLPVLCAICTVVLSAAHQNVFFKIGHVRYMDHSHHIEPSLTQEVLAQICCRKPYLWPSSRFKGLNNQINQIAHFSRLAALVNATVIAPPIESNYNTQTGHRLKRLPALSKVRGPGDGSTLIDFGSLYDMNTLRGALLPKGLCILSEKEAMEICYLDLAHVVAEDLARCPLDTADLYSSYDARVERQAEYMRRKEGVLHTTSPRRWHDQATRVSRSSFDRWRVLFRLVAAGISPGSLLKSILDATLSHQNISDGYNALHLRTESDAYQFQNMGIEQIVGFMVGRVPTGVPLYVAHNGKVDRYRAIFLKAGYRITTKFELAPRLHSVANGHREVLAFFEQQMLARSILFVGNPRSSLATYVMEARVAQGRPSLDYTDRMCCRAGLPDSLITRVMAGIIDIAKPYLYTICIWASFSDNSTGGSSIFMNALKRAFQRRGHTVVNINNDYQDQDLKRMKIGPGDIDFHLLNQNQYPNRLLSKYLSERGPNATHKPAVVMRSDGPFFLHRGDIRQDYQLYRTVSKFCTGLVFQSEWSQRVTMMKGILQDIPEYVTQIVIGNAAEPEFFYRPSSLRSLPPDGRMRVGVAVWSTNVRKNNQLIIDLSSLADPKKFEFVHVGNRPKFDKSAPMTLYPPMAQKELGNFMRDRIDAFLAPSWYECFSNSEIQALTSGLPVVALNESSHPAVIGSGGVLFGSETSRSNATDALAALEHLRTNYAHYASLVSSPNIDSIAEQYLKVANLQR